MYKQQLDVDKQQLQDEKVTIKSFHKQLLTYSQQLDERESSLQQRELQLQQDNGLLQDEKDKQRLIRQQIEQQQQRVQQLQADISTNQHDDDGTLKKTIKFDLLPLKKYLLDGSCANITIDYMINSHLLHRFKVDHAAGRFPTRTSKVYISMC